MIRLAAVLMLAPTAGAPAFAEQEQPADRQAAASSLAGMPVSGSDAVTLKRDHPVRLMVMREVTTKTAHAGDRFPLHVDRDVVLDGVTLIPAGTPAWGEVVSAASSGLVGISGKLTARFLYIALAGRQIALRGEAVTAGTPGTGTAAAATIGFALLGAGPLGVLARGTNAKLKAGEIVTGYIADDAALIPAGQSATAR